MFNALGSLALIYVAYKMISVFCVILSALFI